MTIDERLEALTRSGELLHHSQRDTDENIRHLALIAEQNEVRAAEMMDSIKRLAHIADIHDARISHLEGN
jgi:hypothetical protein